MGLFSSLFDPGNVFGGNEGGVSLSGIFDPGGMLLDNAGVMPTAYGDATSSIDDWGSDIYDFERENFKRMTENFGNNPLGSLVAGTPFSTKVWNKALGKDWDPQVNQLGGATKESYQQAENQGIDTSNARGAHQVAGTIASIYGGGALGPVFGAAGAGAGIGAGAGQALGGAAVGAGNAWANDSGNIFQSALAGALPGLSQMFGGALNGVNTGALGDTVKSATDTFNEYNKASRGMLGSVGKGVATGALGSAMKGDSMGEGAMQGGLQGGLGNLFGQGISALGGGKMSEGFGNALASGALGLYGAHQAKKDIQGQIGQLQGLFTGDSPYAQQLKQQLARKDASAGRRSQYGPREVELQARLAEMNSRNAPQLNNLYNQKSAAQMSQYKDLYNVLRQSGLLGKLGNMGQQYFQGYGNYNQGQQQGPATSLMYENQDY